MVGLSDGNIHLDGESLRNYPFLAQGFPSCSISGELHPFEGPNGEIKPEWNFWKEAYDTIGCGLLQSPENSLSVFFTLNGILMGQLSIRVGHDRVLSEGKFE
jgi:hypothetical protein